MHEDTVDGQAEITRLLAQWHGQADDTVARNLVDAVYAVLREMAAARMAGAPGRDVVLQPTSLMHEALLRMLGTQASYRDRVHFFSVAALQMRSVLVDHARAALAQKRGGDATVLTLSWADRQGGGDGQGAEFEVLALHGALQTFGTVDPRAAHAVELSYFGGLTHEEIGDVLEVSVPTVERDLRVARAWLKRHMGETRA